MTILGDPTTSEQSVALDPFDTPQPTQCLADAAPRTRVVVRGTVWSVGPVVWAGGPVLEATLVDPTGRLVLAFLGRHEVGGIQPGRQLVVAGTWAATAGAPSCSTRSSGWSPPRHRLCPRTATNWPFEGMSRCDPGGHCRFPGHRHGTIVV